MSETIKQYNFKEGLPVEFEILDLNEIYSNHKEDLVNTHRISFYQIVWFKNDSQDHLVDFMPVKIEADTILFLNKDMVQKFGNQAAVDGKIILFTESFFCKNQDDVQALRSGILFNDLLSVPTLQINEQHSPLKKIINDLQEELKQKNDQFHPEIIRNLLKNFLLHSERLRRNQGFKELKKDTQLSLVLQFKELLEGSFHRSRSVSAITEQMNITEKKLNNATVKTLGKSPKTLIDERIILEAKRLLAHTNETVKEIAYQLGFDESSYFVKYFKKHLDCTPLHFRNETKGF